MVAPSYPLQEGAVSGGTAGVSFYLANALRDSGDVTLEIVRPCAPNGSPARFTLDGIPIHALRPSKWQPKHLYLFWAMRSQVRRKLDELRPEIVHVQDDALIAAAVRQPCVFTLHGITERDTFFRANKTTRHFRGWIVRMTHGRMRKKLRNIIAISPYAREHLSPKTQQKIWEIPNPVADSFFKLVRRPEPLRVFSASHMGALKNIKALVRGFAQVAGKDCTAQLRIAGSDQHGIYGNECRALASELGIGEQVKFLGLLNIQNLQEELAAASVFALCSLQENAPLSIAEAMAAGVPILASSVGGIPWMVTDGITGRLVNPEDINSISSVLSHMLASDDLGKMGLAAKQKAEANYRASMVAERTIKVYREILGRTPLAVQ